MISPVEIKKQEFSRAIRGYDSDEVRSFLDSVSGEVEKLLETLSAQTLETERLKAELSAFQQMELNMKEAMVNAQETLRDAREGSKKEADLIRREAELEAERIVQQAEKKRMEIEGELKALTTSRDSFVRKLRSLLRSELDLIQILADEDLTQDDSTNRKG